MKSLLFALALFSTGSAQASPVYLKCAFLADGESNEVDAQLNEEAGMVTYSFPDKGQSYTVRGTFTSSYVGFNGFSVSRTDLSFKRDAFGMEGAFTIPAAYGRCEVDRSSRTF